MAAKSRQFVKALLSILVLTIITTTTVSFAQDASQSTVSPRLPDRTKSVSDFLKPDGSFDLEAVRRSGYQGSLDLKGFQSAIDPVSGQPLFRQAGTNETADQPDDIY